jgi:hypothetical protein
MRLSANAEKAVVALYGHRKITDSIDMTFNTRIALTILLALGLECAVAANPGANFGINIGREVKTLATLKNSYMSTCTEEALAKARKTQTPEDYKKTLGYCEQLVTTMNARGMTDVPKVGAPAAEAGKMKFPQ